MANKISLAEKREIEALKNIRMMQLIMGELTRLQLELKQEKEMQEAIKNAVEEYVYIDHAEDYTNAHQRSIAIKRYLKDDEKYEIVTNRIMQLEKKELQLRHALLVCEKMHDVFMMKVK